MPRKRQVQAQSLTDQGVLLIADQTALFADEALPASCGFSRMHPRICIAARRLATSMAQCAFRPPWQAWHSAAPWAG